MHREPRRKDARPELAFQSRWHAGRAGGSATGCMQPSPAPRHEGGAAGSEPRTRRAAGEAAAAAPGAASAQSPRPRSRASSSTRSPGCWAAGAGEPGMGAGAARPSTGAAAADPGSSTRPSRLRPVENSYVVRTPGRKKGQNPERLVLTAKPWGARAVPLLHASAAAAGPAPRWDATKSPSGASGCGMEAAPGTG